VAAVLKIEVLGGDGEPNSPAATSVAGLGGGFKVKPAGPEDDLRDDVALATPRSFPGVEAERGRPVDCGVLAAILLVECEDNYSGCKC
jgi:hypothetical protein